MELFLQYWHLPLHLALSGHSYPLQPVVLLVYLQQLSLVLLNQLLFIYLVNLGKLPEFLVDPQVFWFGLDWDLHKVLFESALGIFLLYIMILILPITLVLDLPTYVIYVVLDLFIYKAHLIIFLQNHVIHVFGDCGEVIDQVAPVRELIP